MRVYAEVGDLIWQDFEPYRTGLPASDDSREFPVDIENGTTGAVCIDSWSQDLRETGYLHNYIRMWLASYVVHHRRMWWQGGASWFITHFLDSDPSSNNLGWQWVASTWRSYPYLWNRGNLVKYAGDRYCAACPLADAGCPFDATYAALKERLFESQVAALAGRGHLDPGQLNAVPWEPPPTPETVPDGCMLTASRRPMRRWPYTPRDLPCLSGTTSC